MNTGDVTILIYTFPPPGRERDAFARIRASIERTWRLIGLLPTVIVASHHFREVDDFVSAHANVTVQIEAALVPGDIKTMSMDCIKRLYMRFDTPFVLIIQDDGFPINPNIGDFIGRIDFWGAPIISEGWKRKVAYTIGLGSYNGGFSMRSRRLCRYAARAWRYFFRFIFREDSRFLGEDFYYTTWLKLLPTTWLRYRFPTEEQAFRFAFDALNGLVKLPVKTVKPFGIHGKSTLRLLGQEIKDSLGQAPSV